MKIPHVLSTLLLAIGILTAPSLTYAEKPAAKATPRPHHFFKITDVSATSITISDDKTTKTFKIDKDTEITYKGETVTADKLSVGMKATVSPGISDDVASRISASDAPKEKDADKDK